MYYDGWYYSEFEDENGNEISIESLVVFENGDTNKPCTK